MDESSPSFSVDDPNIPEALPCIVKDVNDDTDENVPREEVASTTLPSDMKSFFCPICITEYAVVHCQQSNNDTSETSHVSSFIASNGDTVTDDELNRDTLAVSDEENFCATNDDDDDDEYEYDDTTMGRPYVLRSCNHVMCTQCLSAYCASKVTDGIVNIRCFHTKDDSYRSAFTPAESPGEANACNAALAETDIRYLLEVFEKKDAGSKQQQGERNDTYLLQNSLIRKYERFKFDSIHGEKARRCPICDTPKIFEMVPAPRETNKKTANSGENIENLSETNDRPSRLSLRFPIRRRGIQRVQRHTRDEKTEQADADENADAGDPTSTGSTADSSETEKRGPINQCSDNDKGDESTTKSHESFIKIDKDNLQGTSEGSGQAKTQSADQPQSVEHLDDNDTGESDQQQQQQQQHDTDPPISDVTNDGEVSASASEMGETKPFKVHGMKLQPKEPITTCEECDTEYCYYHSNAHIGRSCDAYAAEIEKLEQENKEYLNRTHTKACPKCGVLVQKNQGCNQMQCTQCGAYFCWLCLAEVDGGTFPTHFQWWNLGGCPNMQMNDSTSPSRCAIVWARLLALVQLIVIGIPAVILAVASSLLCFCLVPGMGNTNRERASSCVSFWGNCLTVVFLIPLILPGFIIGAIMALVSLACKAIRLLMQKRNNEKGNAVSRNVDDDDDTSPEKSKTDREDDIDLGEILSVSLNRVEFSSSSSSPNLDDTVLIMEEGQSSTFEIESDATSVFTV